MGRLLAWLPLTKNTVNKGEGKMEFRSSNLSYSSTGGKINNYKANFNGSNSYVYGNIPLTTTMTFACWIYFNNTNAFHIIDCRAQSGETGYQPMYGGVNYGLQCYSSNGGSYTWSAATCGFTAGVWYHLAVIITESNATLYINGVSKGTQSGNFGTRFGVRQMRIGTRCSGANWFNGSIQDVRVYNTALKNEEINYISKGLVLHYDMDSCYEPIPCVEANGNQGMIIDYTPKSSDKIFADFSITNTGVTSCIWCARGSTTSTNSLTAFYIANSGVRCDYGTSATMTSIGALTANTRHQLTMRRNIWYLDGVQKTSMSSQTFTAGGKIRLFSSYTNGENSGVGNYSQMKLYRFTVFKGSDVAKTIIDLVPVIRTTDLVTGMYDIVHKVFYACNTSTQLLGYQPMQYVENVANTMEIDTGITSSSNITVRMKLCNYQITGGRIIGDGGADNNDWRFFNYNGNIYFDMGSQRINGSSFPVSVVREIELGNYYVKDLETGSTLLSGSTQSWTGSNTIKIGGDSYNRWYYVKIFNQMELVRDFVAAMRTTDRVCGLYDRVNDKFYPNTNLTHNWCYGEAKRSSLSSYTAAQMNGWMGLTNDSWGSITNATVLNTNAWLNQLIYIEWQDSSNNNRRARTVLKLNSVSGTTIYTQNLRWGYEGSDVWNETLGLSHLYKILDSSGNDCYAELITPSAFSFESGSKIGDLSLRNVSGNSNARILTSLNPSFLNGNGTICFWYKKDSTAFNYNSGNFLVATQASSGQYFGATQNGQPFNSGCSYSTFYLDGVAGANSQVNDTDWHFYCFTGVNFSSWSTFCMQAHGDTSWLWRGNIGDFTIYSTNLSASDIKKLYRNKLRFNQQGLIYFNNYLNGDGVRISKGNGLVTYDLTDGTSYFQKFVGGSTGTYDSDYDEYYYDDTLERLEYIETNGSQFLNTNISPSEGIRIELDFMYLGTTYSGWTSLFGSRGSATNTYFAFFINSSSNLVSPNYAGFDPGANSGTKISPNVRHKLTNYGGYFYIDGQENSKISTSNVLTASNRGLYLFANSTSSSYENRNIKVRLYDCKVYSNGTLLRHYIPIKRNGNPYLYECCLGDWISFSGATMGPVMGQFINLVCTRAYGDGGISVSKIDVKENVNYNI